MLSLAGEIPGLVGVGDGAGRCSGINTLAEVWASSGNRWATAPLAMAKEFSDKPATHARAHVRMATFLGDCLGIIPSSGDWSELPPRARSKCLRNEHSKRAPHNAAVQFDCQR